MKKLLGDQDLSELWEFLVAYFGDYWEGKTEKDILDGAIRENPKQYLYRILEQLDILRNMELSVTSKKEFLLDANIYMNSEDETIKWIDLVYTYLRDAIKELGSN